MLLSREEAREIANRTEQALGAFLDLMRPVELESYFDALGLSLLLQERDTFGDIRLLAENGRSAGAQARIRSLWESVVILKYVVVCANSPEDAARAFFLYYEYKRANIMRSTGIWDTLPPEKQQTFEQSRAEFTQLPEPLRTFTKASTELMHREIVARDPALLSRVDVGGVSISQYDAAFRVFSAKVHGGLTGTHINVEEWLNNAPTDPAKQQLDYVGVLITASSWIRDLVSTWLGTTSNPQLMPLWEQSIANADQNRQ